MWFERVIWSSTLVAFVVALGESGKRLTPPPAEPTTAQAILSFAGAIAGFTITYVPPGFRFYDVPFPGWTQVRFSFSMKATGHLTIRVFTFQLEIFPLFASRIFVLRRGSSRDVVVAQFARMDESGPSAMSWSSMCHRHPNRVIADSSVRG